MVIVCFVTEFPAGNVSVTLYCGGVMKGSTHLHYYNTMGEISCLLKQAADPMNFMCQVHKQFGIHKTFDHADSREMISAWFRSNTKCKHTN